MLFFLILSFSVRLPWSSPSCRDGPDRHALPHGLPALRLHRLRHQQHRTHPAAAHHPRLRVRDLLHPVRYERSHTEGTTSSRCRYLTCEVQRRRPAHEVELFSSCSAHKHASRTITKFVLLSWSDFRLRVFLFFLVTLCFHIFQLFCCKDEAPLSCRRICFLEFFSKNISCDFSRIKRASSN